MSAVSGKTTPGTKRLNFDEWIFLGFLLLVWPGVSWALFPSGEKTLDFLGQADRSAVYLQSIAVTTAVFFLLAVILRFRSKEFAGLGYRHFPPADIGVGVLLLIAANSVLLILSAAFPSLQPGPHDFMTALLPRTAGEQWLWLAVSAVAAIGEESLFRGFVMTRVRRCCGGWAPALLLSSIGFGLAHVYQGWPGVILTGMYGAIFGLVVIRRGSIWPCLIAHFLQDALAIVPLDLPTW